MTQFPEPYGNPWIKKNTATDIIRILDEIWTYIN